jgi:hypothetical protein
MQGETIIKINLNFRGLDLKFVGTSDIYIINVKFAKKNIIWIKIFSACSASKYQSYVFFMKDFSVKSLDHLS